MPVSPIGPVEQVLRYSHLTHAREQDFNGDNLYGYD